VDEPRKSFDAFLKKQVRLLSKKKTSLGFMERSPTSGRSS
jgi:hypothetical protein